ncbi:MAG: 23S rRNA (adenine(2030)-N(6))-methyltransferase RlmJ [Pseudomonadota bacterium]
MLSYRHAFHAGNHADVLKHLVLIQLLRYFGQKDAPYMYIDTHAGAGLYALDDPFATKLKEYESGIERLWNRHDLPPPLMEYVALIKEIEGNGNILRYYPGSPYLADKIARQEDRLRLFELHSTDSKILEANFRKLETNALKGRGKRVIIQQADGLIGLKALLPPPSRRGLVLIDPSYEDKAEYRLIIETLADALKRFATGTFVVWYPLLQRIESRQLPEKLKQLVPSQWLNVSLLVNTPSADGFGMHGSGMFVLNPPWTLEKTLGDVMPYLVGGILGQNEQASFTLEKG